ncbi:MAG: biotin synthase BioB [Armatimonadetes bacterium]|nr:biotin synthase BioB [Armatimonadota bacterium]
MQNGLNLADLGQRVLEGGEISFDEAVGLIGVPEPDVLELMAWSNRIRVHFRGNKVHLCSIINVKSGGCPEDCGFCAQSARFNTDVPRHSFLGKDEVLGAAEDAARNGAQAFGIVAAWKGLKEGPTLDEVCKRLEELSQNGKVRADASLGIIPSLEIAQRLKQSGLRCYNHNLETAEEFYPEICSTHTYQDRVQTLRYLKQAGVRICSGGLFNMGETLRHRVQMAFALRELEVDVVPMNFLNPIQGTDMEGRQLMSPMECLKTIAVYRFILPRKEIMVAGGREVNLRSLQPMMFLAGASATMVGNYLTTCGQDPEKDLQMLRDLGLDWEWQWLED